MYWSNFFLKTNKNIPQKASLISHILMLKTGMIKQTNAGIFTFLPYGIKALNNLLKVVKQQMELAKFQEIIMPSLHQKQLWEKSNRWNIYGKELIRLKDRHDQNYCLAPTHEELITFLITQENLSYKDLPISLYQITTKYRDEFRPRGGIIRAREFLMKDAYTFNLNEDCLNKSFETMYQTYKNIFDILEIDYKIVSADSGNIGGSDSKEFQAISESGEDKLAIGNYNFAANIESVKLTYQEPIKYKSNNIQKTLNNIESTYTLNKLGYNNKQILNCHIIKSDYNQFFAFHLRNDHSLNLIKVQNTLKKYSYNFQNIELLETKEQLQKYFNLDASFFIGLNNKIITQNFIDYSAVHMQDFIIGGNKQNQVLINCNWHRDLVPQNLEDLRNAQTGDPCPTGGTLEITKGIEIGHLFKLGNSYTKKFNTIYQNQNNNLINPLMGCYGIGISRLLATYIEQNHDDLGIIFNKILAPFKIHIVPLNFKDQNIIQLSEAIYKYCHKYQQSFLDDRNLGPGIKLNDAELLGFPITIIIGKKNLDNNKIEVYIRNKNKKLLLNSQDWQLELSLLFKKFFT